MSGPETYYYRSTVSCHCAQSSYIIVIIINIVHWHFSSFSCFSVLVELPAGMKDRTPLVFLLLYSRALPVFSLFLSLGSGDNYGIICGFYDRVVLQPEVQISYQSVCENNCQTFIENCVKKMSKICRMAHEKELDDSFCKENNPDIYCRTSLKSDSCVSCRQIPIERTTLVPRTVKKVNDTLNKRWLVKLWVLFSSENLRYWRAGRACTWWPGPGPERLHEHNNKTETVSFIIYYFKIELKYYLQRNIGKYLYKSFRIECHFVNICTRLSLHNLWLGMVQC